jgi:hypothetical protein
MFSRFVTGLYMLAGLALATMPNNATAAAIDMLSSANATWSTSVGKSTCTIAQAASGDSLAATWTMDSGGWTDTWISLVATPSASLHGADSIKVICKITSTYGFSVRLTLRDNTEWEPLTVLSGTPGTLLAGNYALNATTFPQFLATGGTFSVDSIKTISFVNATNPTLLTAAGTGGVFTITQFQIISGNTSVKPSNAIAPRSLGSLRICTTGFTTTRAGAYTISLYLANGMMVSNSTSQYSAGFNKVDFSIAGSGVYIAKVTGNGLTESNRLVFSR